MSNSICQVHAGLRVGHSPGVGTDAAAECHLKEGGSRVAQFLGDVGAELEGALPEQRPLLVTIGCAAFAGPTHVEGCSPNFHCGAAVSASPVKLEV